MSGSVFSSGEPQAELGPHAPGLRSSHETAGLLTVCSALRHSLAPGLKAPEATQPMGAARFIHSKVRGLPVLSTSEDPSVVFLQITSKGKYLRKI